MTMKTPTIWLLLALFVFNITPCFGKPNKITPQRREAIRKRAEEIVKLLPKERVNLGRPVSDRSAWEQFGENPVYRDLAKAARIMAKWNVPELSESVYMEFYQNGNRSNYTEAYGKKYFRLRSLVFAEAIENRGRLIPKIEEWIRSICDDPSWIAPSVDPNADNYHGRAMFVDLLATETAGELGLTDYWLGDGLSPEIRKLIREKVEHRVFKPYEKAVLKGDPEFWWITTTNNWNAVCHAGIMVAAASLIDDPKRLAWYVAASESFSKEFLDGFTDDGYCSEGMMYWGYGFGQFTILCEMLSRLTNGKVDPMKGPKARRCASFPMRMEVAPGQYAVFADSGATSCPYPPLVHHLNRRFQLGYSDIADASLKLDRMALNAVLGFAGDADRSDRSSPTASPLSEWRTFFPDAGVLICRPHTPGAEKQLAMVCKAGHNGEHHNHNDIGSFTVMNNGGVPLLDLGAEVYTGRTFSKRRYESNMLNSFGHPVPVVNGSLQKAGRQFGGTIVSTSFTDDKDVATIDFAAAYGLREVRKLERTFEYTRTSPGEPNSLTVTDTIQIRPQGTFETALTTFSPCRILKEDRERIELIVGSEQDAVHVVVTAFSGKRSLPLTFQREEIREDAKSKRHGKPQRLGFKIAVPVEEARLVVTIMPE